MATSKTPNHQAPLEPILQNFAQDDLHHVLTAGSRRGKSDLKQTREGTRLDQKQIQPTWAKVARAWVTSPFPAPPQSTLGNGDFEEGKLCAGRCISGETWASLWNHIASPATFIGKALAPCSVQIGFRGGGGGALAPFQNKL